MILLAKIIMLTVQLENDTLLYEGKGKNGTSYLSNFVAIDFQFEGKNPGKGIMTIYVTAEGFLFPFGTHEELSDLEKGMLEKEIQNALKEEQMKVWLRALQDVYKDSFGVKHPFKVK